MGDFDTELVEEFLIALSSNANFTLHVRQITGSNAHHIIEGTFKSLARTLKKAVAIDSTLNGEIPSSPEHKYYQEYREYSRLMSKPYKRPLKFQAWRLLDNSASEKKAEVIVGPNDTLVSYNIRYIKKPRAIILSDLEGVTLDNKTTAQTCELDSILHQEILQRAVELAKAAYTGDLKSSVELGQRSE